MALTGAERTARYRRRHPERVRAYKESEAGKATQSRANKRYYDSPHGRAVHRTKEARRVMVGSIYVGTTLTVQSATILNEVIRKEQHARKQQSRA